MTIQIRSRWLRSTVTIGLAVAAVAGLTASPAAAHTRTFIGIHVGIPLHAGPPAYYYGPYYGPYYYAPAPVYYLPPPVYYYAPTVAVPNCSSGRWRQADGSIVSGVACLQPNGTWKLAY